MKHTIHKIVKSATSFAKFLNTLSLLEYIGARKILKSQHQADINEQMIAHAIEELRHATVLKRSAQKFHPGHCLTYHPDELLCGTEAVHYFQSLDHAVQNLLVNQHSKQAYLYTTYLIETRAIAFYTLFQDTLIELDMPSLFRGILIEENNHLTEMLNYLKNINTFTRDIKILEAVEQKEFMDFMQIIDKSV